MGHPVSSRSYSSTKSDQPLPLDLIAIVIIFAEVTSTRWPIPAF